MSNTTTQPPIQYPEFHTNVVWSFMPFILLPNAIVVIAFLTNQKLRITANFFVCALACGDFLVGAVLLPLILAGPGLSSNYVILFTMSNTMMLTCACAYDRYIAITSPLHYRTRLTRSKVYIIISICWIVPMIIASLPKFWIRTKYDVLKECHRIFMACFIFCVVVPILAQIFVYSEIFMIARRHVRAIRRVTGLPPQPRSNPTEKRRNSSIAHEFMQEVRFAKQFASVAFTFILFWIPICYINIVDNILLRPEFMPNWIVEISFYCMWFSSIFNPILYGMFQRKFRQTVSSWFKCCKCLQKRSRPRLSTAKETRSQVATENCDVITLEKFTTLKSNLGDV